MKKIRKYFFCVIIFRPLLAKVVKSETTSFHKFFHKDSKNLKSFNIGLREVEAQRPLNGVRKCDRQTDRQIFQLIDKIGPEG